MNSEEFLNYTSPENDVNSVLYILDYRLTDQIEYLVRYSDPNHKYDEWKKASDLTCYKKVIEFYEGKVPNSIVKNLKPVDQEPEQLPPNSADKFTIYGAEIENNTIMLRVHIPGTPGIVTKDSEELKEKYSAEIVDYYENHYLGNK